MTIYVYSSSQQNDVHYVLECIYLINFKGNKYKFIIVIYSDQLNFYTHCIEISEISSRLLYENQHYFARISLRLLQLIFK